MLGSYVDKKIAIQKSKLNYCKQAIKIFLDFLLKQNSPNFMEDPSTCDWSIHLVVGSECCNNSVPSVHDSQPIEDVL